MTARTLLLGDWNRVVRDPLDVARIAYWTGAVVWIAQGGAGAGNLVVGSAALLVARIADLPRIYDLAFLLAMVLTGWGEAFGLYDLLPWYDNVVHFLVPMMTSQVAYLALARAEVLPDLRDPHEGVRRDLGIFVVTFALGMAIGGLWEVYEWSSDRWLGTDLSMDNDDTVTDLVADGSGALVGGGLLVLWNVKGWGSVRRIPGVNTHEDVSA